MEGASRGIERIIKSAASNNIVIDVFLLSTFTALGLRSFNQQNNIQALEAEKESLTKSNKTIRKTLWDWKQQLYAEASTDSALVPLPRLKSIYGESPSASHSGRYYTDQWLQGDPSRKLPNRDIEVSNMRRACFRRLFLDLDAYDKVSQEYADFSMKSGVVGSLDSLRLMHIMEPKSWWANYGDAMPMLQRLAFKVLGQPTSSSCCERNWSTYSFIHSLRRYKLNPKRVDDLVFIHNNLRLLSRNTTAYYEDKAKMWDVGGDEFDMMDDADGGFLQFASLSLDEPELESVFFTNDADV